MHKRKNVFACLDLRPDSIRVLIMRKQIGKVKQLIQGNYTFDDLTQLSRKIGKHQPGEVILLLPDERVIVRDLTLPPVDKRQIKAILGYELAGKIPYQIEQVDFDYIILKKTRKELKIKAFITPINLRKEIEFLKKAGITITRILPRGLAITTYLMNKGLGDNLVKFSLTSSQMVLYPNIDNYFCCIYYPEQEIDFSELKQIIDSKKLSINSENLTEIEQPLLDLEGGILFHLKYPYFNFLRSKELQKPGRALKIGSMIILLAIIFVNGARFYLDYQKKLLELQTYQAQMEYYAPKVQQIKDVTAKIRKIEEDYERLENIYINNRDYLIWLKELHLLLQEDTEVNTLIFEGDQLKELHGKAPSATKVSSRLLESAYFMSPEFTSPITPKIEDDGIFEEFSITATLTIPTSKGDDIDD